MLSTLELGMEHERKGERACLDPKRWYVVPTSFTAISLLRQYDIG